MTTQNNLPQFQNKPVILIHLVLEDGETAYCQDFKYFPDNISMYPNTPRIICPACNMAAISEYCK